jgi:hypothetical protein
LEIRPTESTKAAGEALTVKKAPHRPGNAPALGLRAGRDVFPLYCKPTRKDVMLFRSYVPMLALAVFAIPALSNSVSAGEPVPFQGVLKGERVALVPLDPPFVYAQIDAEGTATQIGKYQLVFKAIVNPSTLTATGTFEIVAADGATLFGEFVGESSPTATPGVNAFVEVAVITDGTGRFAGATGGFRTERLLDTATLQTIGTFKGAISLAP